MARRLPPELERLGDALTEATTRAAIARRRPRRITLRMAACLLAGVAVFAFMPPTHLGPAQAPNGLLSLASVEDAYGSSPCDPPHGPPGAQAAAGCLADDPPPQAR